MDDNWNKSCSINRWRVGAPRHDITVNLVNNLFQIFEFKIDRIEIGSLHRRILGKGTDEIFSEKVQKKRYR